MKNKPEYLMKKGIFVAFIVVLSVAQLTACTRREVGTGVGAAAGAGLGYAVTGSGWGAAAGAAGGAVVGNRLAN
jgi:hypothetical protein